MEDSSISDADRLVRFLVDTARCGECGASYNSEDVYVLDQVNRHVWELAAVCPGCLSVWLVKAVVRPKGVPAPISGAGPSPADGRMVPADELTVAERQHFASMEPITVDEVLDVSAFLRTFDGDFRAYFCQESDGQS
jgi:hypothetical protein